MSENVMSAGIMVPLSRRLTELEREVFDEEFYQQGVHINYEGTIVYTDDRPGECGIRFGGDDGSGGLARIKATLTELDATELAPSGTFLVDIVADQARTYGCYWYNGADSDMGLLTLGEFLEKTEQA